MRLVVLEADGRATDLHASAAGTALFGVDLQRGLSLDVLQEGTGTTGDDDRGSVSRKLLLDGGVTGGDLYTTNDTITHNKVPNVIGKTPEEANKILLNSGFNIKIEGSLNFTIGSGAKVVSQYPLENEYYELGKTVTIKILYIDEKD